MELEKLNNFLFQHQLYFMQFIINIIKFTFVIIYLTKVVQDWFKIRLN